MDTGFNSHFVRGVELRDGLVARKSFVLFCSKLHIVKNIVVILHLVIARFTIKF